MKKETLKLAKKVYEEGKSLVENIGEIKVNKKLFPPCFYKERKELVEGEGRISFADREKRVLAMEERGHTSERINRCLPIFDSIRSVGQLTENAEMLNLLNFTTGDCRQIVIDKIAEVIESGKISFLDEIYMYDIIKAWNVCEDEEKDVVSKIDDQASKLCFKVCDDYKVGYDFLKQSGTEIGGKEIKLIENLVEPEKIFEMASCASLGEESAQGD